MGERTWMLIRSSGSAREALAAGARIDRAGTLDQAQRLFPRDTLKPLEDGNLTSTGPARRILCAGCFAGISVFAAREFAVDNPSRLSASFIRPDDESTLLLAMHSVVDWFAFALWHRGRLSRSLSVSPDSGVIEDIGPKLPFELRYWDGQHPVTDDTAGEPYPLPFHPLDLGEAALGELLGYHLAGPADGDLFDPETVPLLRFRRSRSWFRRRR